MATTGTLIPVAEYLASSYRPDCDYLEGEVRERNFGDQLHSIVQGFFVGVFGVNGRAWSVRALPEVRVKVGPERYRVPDVCVIERQTAFERILTRPPLLCIEVLSPGDSLSELQERVDDYAAMGVGHIWAVDPMRRRAYLASAAGFAQPQARELTVVGTPIRVSLDGCSLRWTRLSGCISRHPERFGLGSASAYQDRCQRLPELSWPISSLIQQQ